MLRKVHLHLPSCIDTCRASPCRHKHLHVECGWPPCKHPTLETAQCQAAGASKMLSDDPITRDRPPAGPEGVPDIHTNDNADADPGRTGCTHQQWHVDKARRVCACYRRKPAPAWLVMAWGAIGEVGGWESATGAPEEGLTELLQIPGLWGAARLALCTSPVSSRTGTGCGQRAS